jgi:hypothetical protein
LKRRRMDVRKMKRDVGKNGRDGKDVFEYVMMKGYWMHEQSEGFEGGHTCCTVHQ